MTRNKEIMPADTAQEIVLRADRLKKSFVSGFGKRKESTDAVRDVSFELRRGETIGLIGTSGCGKTTTLRMLLGLLRPDSGSITRNGKISFVGQDPYSSLAPTFTVGQIIAEPLIFTHVYRKYEQCADAVRSAMEAVHLDYDTYAARLPSQLSGGERQRISIARALVLEPDFLIMDEPTSMLDEEVKGKIAEVIQEISDSGRFGVLIVTHDIAIAARLCQKLMVMENGSIIEQDTSGRILTVPQQELTKSLIAVATDVEQYWAKYRALN